MIEIARPKLSDYTTLHLGGHGIALLEARTMKDLPALFERAEVLGGEIFPIGRGSNLLAPDGELPIVLLSMRQLDQIKIVSEDNKTAIVEAEAGVPLPRLLRFCLENGLSGLEGLTGIPGSVGGACAMNAGSFGTTLGDLLERVMIWTNEGFRECPRESLQFSYRAFNVLEVTGIFIIISVILTLTKAKKDGIFSRMSLNYFNKKTRQPLSDWSAGCAFKNPASGISAGRLLEQAGLRGYRRGGMAFSARHANFLINEGSGTSIAALELLNEARLKVMHSTGIELSPEIKIMPWF